VDEARCSVASQQVGEPLAGTAVESVDRWLLLEVTDTWAPKAIQTEALPANAREALARWLETPRTRLQLIRRPGRSGKRPLFMVVSASNAEHRVAKVELDALDDLQAVELGALPEESCPPICLVCVHGRRDRCCAQHGSAVYRAIQTQDVDVWQTSHLGGHRFAACALWLPDGLMYGRLRAEHALAFVSANRAGEVGDLDRFRGRCAYDRPTQAAEIFVRRRLGIQATDALSWLSTDREGDSIWEARFDTSSGAHLARVTLEPMPTDRPASCSGPPEPVSRFVEL
jgi:hypothetical protein